MGLQLLQEGASGSLLRHRLNSGKWWVIVGAHPMALDLATVLERRHYSGQANEDFEMLMCIRSPFTPVGFVAFAHKRRATAEQMAQCLQDAFSLRRAPRPGSGQDILMPLPGPDAEPLAWDWFNRLVGCKEG